MYLIKIFSIQHLNKNKTKQTQTYTMKALGKFFYYTVDTGSEL